MRNCLVLHEQTLLESPQKPHGFRLTLGPLNWVSRVSQPSGLVRRPSSKAQTAGLRYEKRVKTHLSDLFQAHEVEAGTWWSFRDLSGQRLCQTDVLIWSDHLITIVEIKAQHTTDAWWQLRHLYEPVLRAFRPAHHINVLEVCRSFEPVQFPEKFDRVSDIAEWAAVPQEHFGVCRWRP